MKNPIESFRDHFNDVVEEVQRFAVFVRAIEFQQQSVAKLETLLDECTKAKEKAIAEQSEDAANAYLSFEFMAKALIEEFRFYLALKADNPDSAWDHLVNAESSSAAAMKSHAVASHLDGYIHRLHAMERLLFPQPVFFSAGFIVRESECSICGAEYGECSHVKGRPYMGKLCARIVKKADLQEVSVVSDPADKHCRALHYTDDGVTKNVFTQRAIKDQDAEQSPPAYPGGRTDAPSGSAEA
ncbi:conserved hypothetical protein [Prosthecochloris aestuarii DSM 271]|uniref:Uncharacterized protein n=1 Tax=Prosthecochloris aestuarii (strain DSM 271 / SK 413) TaxID=290512 RepID=B4S7U4_PROA2|nr:hypothetical protein [Prosthecochloris aestuarii]ACF46131.1 conserved hypothetical protein [Prosthecochloris aestuarii DSM 271]